MMFDFLFKMDCGGCLTNEHVHQITIFAMASRFLRIVPL